MKLLYLLCYAEHKYPYDWRTKKPTIFRATEQWFASVEGFRPAAMDAIGQVKWVPPQVLMFNFYWKYSTHVCLSLSMLCSVSLAVVWLHYKIQFHLF